MAKIYAPNKNYTGVSAGVSFVRGVGETNDPHLIDWFRRKGYRVEIDEAEKVKKVKKAEDNAEQAEAKSEAAKPGDKE